MQIKGQVKVILPLESGTSKAGKDWSKQSFVVGFQSGTYDKELCIDITAPKTLEFFQKNVKVGDTVNCEINVESRLFGTKYYTNVGCWKIEKESASNSTDNDPFAPENDEPIGDLPF